MTKARRIAAIIVVIITSVFFIAANWDLEKAKILGGGDVRCHAHGHETYATIWESHSDLAGAVGCTIDGTYRAPKKPGSTCKAQIVSISPNGTQGAGAPPIERQDGEKQFHIANARELRFYCNGTLDDTRDSCHYEITRVSCAPPADNVNLLPGLGAAVVKTSVKCGKDEGVIWKPPAGPALNSVCNVTVNFVGTEHCAAEMAAKYQGQFQSTIETAREPKLVTFVGIRKLSFECKGKGQGQCSYSIVSRECK